MRRQRLLSAEKVTDPVKLLWLPEPVLDASKEHFKQYDDVENTGTTEDRPSLHVQKPPKGNTRSLQANMPTEQTPVPTEQTPVPLEQSQVQEHS